ncbi:two-component system capsular synthesis response regulator RcsB [Burkholderia ambifaria]|nr:response regulator transcription factor [Burkholderia ambifaria]MDR6504146.1 two-component system capsular synthesis response regulator RcsB [Burkholderia ambifaria]
MSDSTIRVVLADDHPAVLIGLKLELASSHTVSVTATAQNSTELMEVLNTRPCDVLICDYAMPGTEHCDGLALFQLILKRHPKIKIVVLTMMENSVILRSLSELGINCIVSKSDQPSHLTMAVHAAYTNGRYMSPSMESAMQRVTTGRLDRIPDLSPRELEVVRFFVSGMNVNEIAAHLRRSKKTISTQKNMAMQKLGIERDVDLVRYGMETGLIPSIEYSIPQAETQRD